MIYQTERKVTPENRSFFLQKIKSETSEQHRLLESNDLLFALMKEDVTMHQYYCYLVLMGEVMQQYEKSVKENLDTIFPEFANRLSSIDIADDLSVINYSTAGRYTLKNYISPSDYDDISYLMGYMYVVEGSKLGGKVIYKHIQRCLGLDESSGAKYISDYRHNTGMLWRKFLEKFSNYVLENDTSEQAIKGATDAFASIYNYFESNRSFYAI